MAEDLRYLDAEDGEMGWSVPSVGAATHSITYLIGEGCQMLLFNYGKDRVYEADAGSHVAVPLVAIYDSSGQGDALSDFYIGWRSKGSGMPTDLSNGSQLNDLVTFHVYDWEPYAFTMPDDDIYVCLYVHDDFGISDTDLIEVGPETVAATPVQI